MNSSMMTSEGFNVSGQVWERGIVGYQGEWRGLWDNWTFCWWSMAGGMAICWWLVVVWSRQGCRDVPADVMLRVTLHHSRLSAQQVRIRWCEEVKALHISLYLFLLIPKFSTKFSGLEAYKWLSIKKAYLILNNLIRERKKVWKHLEYFLIFF